MSVCHEVAGLPSIALPAVPGESASPSGEKTVALVGWTMLPERAGLAADDAVEDVGPFSPSSSLLRPPPTEHPIVSNAWLAGSDLRGRVVDPAQYLGAVGHRGRLLQQVQKR